MTDSGVGDLRRRIAAAYDPDDDIAETRRRLTAIAESLSGLSADKLDALVQIALDSPELRQPVTTVASIYFDHEQRKLDQTGRGDVWNPAITEFLSRLLDDLDCFLVVSSGVTWVMRMTHPVALNSLSLSETIGDGRRSTPSQRTRFYLLLQRARYDFNFDEIGRILSAMGPAARTEPYFRAMGFFSGLGRGEHFPIEQIEEVAGSTDSEKVLTLLLHGLWFTAGAEETDLMLRLCGRLLIINPHDPVTYMRQAAAYRRQGKHSQAIDAITTAIALQPPNDRELHADLKLERVTIAIQQDATQRLEEAIEDRVDRASRGLTEEMDKLIEQTDRQMSDSLFKVVEILGIFTAIISVIATVVGASALGDIPWWARLLLVVTGGAVTIGFFWLLRWIVRPPVRVRETPVRIPK